MSNIMMNPALAVADTLEKFSRKAQVEPDNKSSFSDYMDKKVRVEQNDKKNLLAAQNGARKTVKAPSKESRESETQSVEAILQQLMADLKKMAESTESDAGEWNFQLNGFGLLEKMAQEAGMDISQLALLKKKMEEEGSLALGDLFSVMEDHFEELSKELALTVPETNLPMLETLLSKMGLSAQQLKELSAQGVSDLGELDIFAYLQGLQKLSDNDLQPITLSDWELEQLQGMLFEAGVSKELMSEMFSEKLADWQRALAGMNLEEGDVAVELGFERLKDLLEQTLASAESAKAKTNLPGFLEGLHTVLSQAGFESKDVGWNPVVQESMTSVYQELQKMIDLAKVKIEKVSERIAAGEKLSEQWLASGSVEVVLDDETLNMFMGDAANNGKNSLDSDLEIVGSAMEKTDDGFKNVMSAQSSVEEVAPEQGVRGSSERLHMPRVKLGPEMQQFTTEQISQGVARGLRNNQHHLTLTLYPKELGEVKVDLQVRGSQLSINFMMETRAVKEALESNMQDFKDNLEKQGFNLQDCSLSMGDSEAEDTRQRFEAAWQDMIVNKSGEKSVDPAEVILSMVEAGSAGGSLQPGKVSLFV